MADAEAKPVVEFTKVRLLQNNNQILFFKDAAMLLFFLSSLSCV